MQSVVAKVARHDEDPNIFCLWHCVQGIVFKVLRDHVRTNPAEIQEHQSQTIMTHELTM